MEMNDTRPNEDDYDLGDILDSLKDDVEEIINDNMDADTSDNMSSEEEPQLSDEEIQEQLSKQLHLQNLQSEIFLKEKRKKTMSVLADQGVDDSLFNSWKSTHKSVYTFTPSSDDVYVWRPILKHEWDTIQRTLKNSKDAESKTREAVIRRCVLYPKITSENIGGFRAGLLNSLSELILEGSYFFSLERSLEMVLEM